MTNDIVIVNNTAYSEMGFCFSFGDKSHISSFSLGFPCYKADSMEGQCKQERGRPDIKWESFLEKIRITCTLSCKLHKGVFPGALVLPVLVMLAGWGHRGLEGAGCVFRSPVLLVQQPVGSTRDTVLENSPCKINLAPEIPRVDTLPSCAFPADFILLLVCVEFW